MKARLPLLFVMLLSVAVVVMGCRSFLADSGSTDASATDATATDTSGSGGDGFFVDGSHDIVGGGPPPTPDETQNTGEKTQSHFRAIQLDPTFEDTAGPKFLAAADMNGDGLLDVVSGHNQSQALQLHLQQRDANGAISFRTVNLAGNMPVTIIAGVKIADIDQDGGMDIVMLVKHTGITALCLDGEPNEDMFTGMIVILFSPYPDGDLTDGEQWMQVRLQDSHPAFNHRWGAQVAGDRAKDFPEDGGYTSLAVGDLDNDGFPDIVATSNVPERECGTQLNTVEVWYNPGNDPSPRNPAISKARDGLHVDIATEGPPSLTTRDDLDFWYPVFVLGVFPITVPGMAGDLDPILDNSGAVVDPVTGLVTIVDIATIKACALLDVDDDGDLDIVTGWADAISQNVRWHRNPLMEQGPDALVQGLFINTNGEAADTNGVSTPFDESIAVLSTTWERRPIGAVDGNVGALTIGDMDNDGFPDVFVRDAESNTALWFRRPTLDDGIDPQFPPDNPDTATGDNTPTPDRFDFPWQVFAMDAYDQFRPNGIATGDLTNDGQTDAVVAVGGALFWYDHTTTESNSPLDQWGRDFVLDDTKLNGTTDDPTDIDFANDGTLINQMLVVDLDGDGVNDILATFDRRVNGGLTDDTIVWFRNTLFDDTTGE